MDAASWVIVGFFLLFFPFALTYPVLFALNRGRDDRAPSAAVPGRRLLVAICSNGGAPEVVAKIVARLASYAIPSLETVAIVEERDPNAYPCRTVVVPAEYRPPNGSLDKHRALHFFAGWLAANGYGPETYVVHLDDDSIVPARYLHYVLGMTAEAGQGALRLRAIGHHWFSTVADFGRAINCATFCTFFNARGHPLGVHGEGLVIRADVESEIGWDFQPVCAEDFLMGQSIVRRGYRFDYVPGGIYIAPPVSTRDFFEQRRRWMHRFFSSIRRCWRLNATATTWFAWQALAGGTVVIGLIAWAFVAAGPTHPPYPLLAGTTFCLTVSFLTFQWEASQTGKLRWNFLTLVLFAPATVYNSCTFFYYALRRRPERWISIRKV